MVYSSIGILSMAKEMYVQAFGNNASKMFNALAKASVNIEMITTSEIRITCLVKETQLDQAVRAVHSAFDVG